MKDNLIIGAGPAGMACAMELLKNGVKPVIIEKEHSVGGLSTTLQFREGDLLFRTDIGPHRFFSKNKYLYDFIEELLGEEWKLVPRKTQQCIEGIFYDYPINAFQAFRNIGFMRSCVMLYSYICAVVLYTVLKKEVVTFEDYVVAQFGRKLALFNMINYTEKIWGIPASEIHQDWAHQRIKGLNLFSALFSLVAPQKQKAKSLVSSFYYPQYGTGLIYETIAQKVQKEGGEILTGTQPIEIRHDGMCITDVVVATDGVTQTFTPKHLISSMPITQFVQLLNPLPPKEVLDASASLTWRSQVYLFVTLNKNRVTENNWIYFPDTDIPFGRISEMKNFSADMAPLGKTSLLIEFFVNEGDALWNMEAEDVFALALTHCEQLGLFTSSEVRNYYVFKKTHVYPVYTLTYVSQLEVIKKYLDQFSNLLYIGRPGRFRYNNQDHSLEMGIEAARSIATGVLYDFDSVGSEKEYFEKGVIKG